MRDHTTIPAPIDPRTGEAPTCAHVYPSGRSCYFNTLPGRTLCDLHHPSVAARHIPRNLT
jgi:hypothetical protein